MFEPLDLLTIVSAFSTDDSGLAFATLKMSGSGESGYQTIRLEDIWTDSETQGEFFTALKNAKADTYLFNGESTPEGPKNPLLDRAKACGLAGVKYADPFKFSEGKAIFDSLEVNNQIIGTPYAGWQKLETHLKRSNTPQASEVWAFLQGVIYTSGKIGSGNEYTGGLSSFYRPPEDRPFDPGYAPPMSPYF